MDISNRNLSLRKFRQPKNNNKIKSKYTIATLNNFARYALSKNTKITKQGLHNMQRLFRALDMSLYANDEQLLLRIHVINKALEARLDMHLTDIDMIKGHINGGFLFGTPISLKFDEISNKDIEWIDENIALVLKYGNMLNYSDEIMEYGTKLKGENIQKSTIEGFENMIEDIYKTLKKIQPDDTSMNRFSLSPEVFQDRLYQTYSILTNSTNKLRTNMIGLNKLLKGGFEKSRTYMFLGNTGGGKSLTLLNIALQMKAANKGYMTNDPTKRPAILYITMENNLNETINRFFKISTNSSDMSNYTFDEVWDKIQHSDMMLKDDTVEGNDIDLLMQYVPSKSIDTMGILDIIDAYERDGYEIICVIQDHIKKLQSSFRFSDVRIELGEIANELKVIAADRNIPVITNSHLNREAGKKVGEAFNSGRIELVRLIDLGQIGESQLMSDNTDVVIGLAMEKLDSNKYMGISLLKSRDGTGLDTNTIFLPFEDVDSIRLLQDVGSSFPSFKQTLKPANVNPALNGMPNINITSFATNTNLNSLVNNCDMVTFEG
jgi:dnaB-like helicase C terminal domain|nr:MAG TPA: DNA polymerase B Like Replicative Helicase [Caudoviricetes sp.]